MDVAEDQAVALACAGKGPDLERPGPFVGRMRMVFPRMAIEHGVQAAEGVERRTGIAEGVQ